MYTLSVHYKPGPGQTVVKDWMKKEIENALSPSGADIPKGQTNKRTSLTLQSERWDRCCGGSVAKAEPIQECNFLSFLVKYHTHKEK